LNIESFNKKDRRQETEDERHGCRGFRTAIGGWEKVEIKESSWKIEITMTV